jgi:hypothetical protein
MLITWLTRWTLHNIKTTTKSYALIVAQILEESFLGGIRCTLHPSTLYPKGKLITDPLVVSSIILELVLESLAAESVFPANGVSSQ